MVYSSSNVWAEYKYGDQFFFLKRQLFFASLGTVAMIVIMFIPYVLWKKYAKILLFACFLLLLLVLIPGIGIVRGGAQSWIGVGVRSEEHTSELQSRGHLVCRLLLEKKK